MGSEVLLDFTCCYFKTKVLKKRAVLKIDANFRTFLTPSVKIRGRISEKAESIDLECNLLYAFKLRRGRVVRSERLEVRQTKKTKEKLQ